MGKRVLACAALSLALSGCGTVYSAYQMFDIDGVRPEEIAACADYSCLAALPDTEVACEALFPDGAGETIFRFVERESRGWAVARFFGHTAAFFVAGGIADAATSGASLAPAAAAGYWLLAGDPAAAAVVELYGDADFIARFGFDIEGNVVAFEPGPRLAAELGVAPGRDLERGCEPKDRYTVMHGTPAPADAG